MHLLVFALGISEILRDPVVAKHRASSHTSRVSIDQLLQVAVGSFVNDWYV